MTQTHTQIHLESRGKVDQTSDIAYGKVTIHFIQSVNIGGANVVPRSPSQEGHKGKLLSHFDHVFPAPGPTSISESLILRIAVKLPPAY